MPLPAPCQRPSRWLRRIAVLTLLGAGATLLIAWLSPWAAVRITRFDTEGFWSASPARYGELSWTVPVPPHWPIHASTRSVSRSLFLDEHSHTAPHPIPKRGSFYSVEEYRFGLPLRAMAFAFLREHREGQPSTVINTERGVWTIPRTGQLPLTPLWIGFSADTLMFATLAGALWQTVLAVRRAQRRRTGRCAACVYNRAGLVANAFCPECGSGS